MNIKVAFGAFRQQLNSFLDRLTGFRIINRREHLTLTVTTLVNWALCDRHQVKCVQVGAHDGRTGDHLYELRSDHRWTSHLVEPNPAVLPILYRNTRHEAGTVTLPFALASQPGHLELWTVKVSNLPSSLKGRLDFTQISALERSKVQGELKALSGVAEVPAEWMEATKVEVITWEILFRDHVKSAPDCVLLDAEGQDALLLRDFPFHQILPAVVVFEHLWMTVGEFEEIRDLFQSKGYTLFPVMHDTVAIQSNVLGAMYRN